jgi:hypothetical protein
MRDNEYVPHPSRPLAPAGKHGGRKCINKNPSSYAFFSSKVSMKYLAVTEWLLSLTLNHLPLTTVGSSRVRVFGFISCEMAIQKA